MKFIIGNYPVKGNFSKYSHCSICLLAIISSISDCGFAEKQKLKDLPKNLQVASLDTISMAGDSDC